MYEVDSLIGKTIVLEHLHELPELKGQNMYLDAETTSCDPEQTSLNPHHPRNKIAGLAIASDDGPVYYIPINHYGTAQNLEQESVFNWLQEVYKDHEVWVNQNIPYDEHVIFKQAGLSWHKPMRDTLLQARLIDTDRMLKGGYKLEALVKAYTGHDIYPLKHSLKPYLKKNKDYGRVPIDILGAYAGGDIYGVRALYAEQVLLIPEDGAAVFELEYRLQKILIKMERRGLQVNLQTLKASIECSFKRIGELELKIFELSGDWLNVSSPNEMEDFMLVKYGLPIIAYTTDDPENEEIERRPSFATRILKEYFAYPQIPKELLAAIIELREEKTFFGLFLKTYAEQQIDSVMHPSHNQVLRTGRMSMSKPNGQQLNKRAKELIVPPEGYTLIRADYSTIEFRLIAYLINDRRILAAYNENPDTDFHELLARINKVSRRVSKLLSFMTCYGAGKKKITKALTGQSDVVQTAIEALGEEATAELVQQFAEKKAKIIYEAYHRQMPSLKNSTNFMQEKAKTRGYTKTLLGRRRHISDPKFSFIAFNACAQGSAADIAKNAMIELDAAFEGTPLEIILQVHDEIVSICPTDVFEANKYRICRDYVAIMEKALPFKLGIPLRASIGYSDKNWLMAGLTKEDVEKLGLPPDTPCEFTIPLEDIEKAEKFKWMKNS